MYKERLVIVQTGVFDPKTAREQKHEQRQGGENLCPAGSIHVSSPTRREAVTPGAGPWSAIWSLDCVSVARRFASNEILVGFPLSMYAPRLLFRVSQFGVRSSRASQIDSVYPE